MSQIFSEKDVIDLSTEALHGAPSVSVLRMPYNYKENTVQKVLNDFLLHSKRPYIITGYTSLKQLVHFFSHLPDGAMVRLLLGNEPSLSSTRVYKDLQHTFPEEVEAYWLEQGLSLRQSLDLVKTLECFEQDRIEAQYLNIPGRMLHAKIYMAEDRAMIGSSKEHVNKSPA